MENRFPNRCRDGSIVDLEVREVLEVDCDVDYGRLHFMVNGLTDNHLDIERRGRLAAPFRNEHNIGYSCG